MNKTHFDIFVFKKMKATFTLVLALEKNCNVLTILRILQILFELKPTNLHSSTVKCNLIRRFEGFQVEEFNIFETLVKWRE